MLAAGCLLASCEKVILDEESHENANVIIRVSSFEQMPFTRATQPVTALCTRLNFAIYQNGEKVKTVAQKQGDIYRLYILSGVARNYF